MDNQNSRVGRAPKKKRKIFLKLFLILVFIGCLAILAGVGLFWSYAKSAPELKDSKLEDTLSSKFYDINGNLIQELGSKKRETITANEIPQQLKDAITSIEDKRFYKHIGVDPIRIVGAFVSNAKGNSLQGGSTLTQQLIKLSYFSTKEEDQTIKRKAQEAWLAIKLERKKSKDEILMYYINKVYMNNGVYGMETAAQSYYGKSLDKLTLAQTAIIAGMPQAPADYDPTSTDKTVQKAAKERRDLVLKEMYADKKITKKEYTSAVNTAITDGIVEQKQTSQTQKVIDNYLKEVIKEVEQKTKKNVYTDGMSIYTNLDMNAQNYLYNLVNSDEYILYPSDDFKAAVTVVDVKTGQVRAQIGSRKVADGVTFGENLATTSKRDLGSTVKPITDYGPAIEYLNYSTGRYVLDAPYNYPGQSTTTPVENYDLAYKGNITIRQALIDSRNIPAVKTLEAVGLDKSAEFLKKLGINYSSTEMTYSKGISSDSISPMQLAAAYAAFANGGTYYKPYYVNKIVYPDKTEETYSPNGTRAMKDSTAYMITNILEDVISKGTGTNAQILGLTQAGKTGTSNYKDGTDVIGDANGSPDSSFVGYTSNYSISVWTGYQNYNQSISGTDTKIASSIYRYLMGYISQNITTTGWEQPESVVKLYNELYVKGHTTDQNTWSGTSNSTNDYSKQTENATTTPTTSSAEQTQEQTENQTEVPASSESLPDETSSQTQETSAAPPSSE